MSNDPTEVIPTPPPPPPPGPADTGSHRGVVIAVVVAAVVIVAVVVAVLAWPSGSQSDDASATSAAGETAATSSLAPAGADSGGEGGPDSAGSGSGSGSGGSGSSGGGGGATAAAVTIKSFDTPGSIDCHNGNSQTFTAKWSTANAEKVTISIDGSGIYDTYGPSGETSLPFNCSSPHTFLLKAYGKDAKSTSKSVTLKPRNVQPAGPPSSAGED